VKDAERALQKLRTMREALEFVPVTQRAKVCGAAAELAVRCGVPAEAEAILAELLDTSRDNPNPRIRALAACYCALAYARLDAEMPKSIRRKIAAPGSPSPSR
jgi:hypothetical protein